MFLLERPTDIWQSITSKYLFVVFRRLNFKTTYLNVIQWHSMKQAIDESLSIWLVQKTIEESNGTNQENRRIKQHEEKEQEPDERLRQTSNSIIIYLSCSSIHFLLIRSVFSPNELKELFVAANIFVFGELKRHSDTGKKRIKREFYV